MTSTRALCFFIYPGFELLDLTGPLTVMNNAIRHAPCSELSVHVVAPEAGPVQSNNHLSVIADLGIKDMLNLDVHSLICVGGALDAVEHLIEDQPLMDALYTAGQGAYRCLSICTGAFLLAQSGIAKNRRMTTHWGAIQKLSARYPDLNVEADALYIQDGRIWSSAGSTAGIDMALAIIDRDFGRDMSLAIARGILMHRIRSGGQSQYSADLAAQARGDTRLVQLCCAVRDDPAKDWQIDEISAFLSVSRRTLSRLCQSELGLSPAQLVERLRLDLARTALVETDAAIKAIAENAGFGSVQRMERAFHRHMSTTPREFRARFRSPFAQESDHEPEHRISAV